MDMHNVAPWRKSREDRDKQEVLNRRALQEHQLDVAVFQRAFGTDDETRTSDQKRMLAKFRRMCGVDRTVFVFQPGMQGDPLRAAQNDGRRDVFFSVMDFIKTNQEE
jgi:hypothetical protein